MEEENKGESNGGGRNGYCEEWSSIGGASAVKGRAPGKAGRGSRAGPAA